MGSGCEKMSINDPLEISALSLAVSMVTAVVMAFFSSLFIGWQSRTSATEANAAATIRQKADWDREDRVSLRQEEAAANAVLAADAAAAHVAEAAKLLDENQKQVAERTSLVLERIEEVHGIAVETHILVNDRLTKALNATLIALRGQEVVYGSGVLALDPTAQKRRDEIRKEILVLERELADRAVAQVELETKKITRGTC